MPYSLLEIMPYNIVFSLLLLLLLLPFYASPTILYITILKKQFSCKPFNLFNNNFPHTPRFPLTNNHSRHAMHRPASQPRPPSEITYNPTTEIPNLTKNLIPVSWYCKSRCGISRYRTIYQYVSSLGLFFPRQFQVQF